MAKKADGSELAGLFQLQPTRREFLAYIGTLLAASACGNESVSSSTTPPPPAPSLASDPFTLGVASGDPLSESVILWTRLALDPIHGGGMPDGDVPVIWEVALDEDFRDVVREGWLFATPALGHSVHIEVDGLGPDSWYFYRMKIGDQWTSPTGRTRTLPAPGSSPDGFRLALASCQHYRQGYYNSHFYLAQEDIDLVAFVGDYIYETGVGEGDIRQHEAGTPRTLEEFRNRYGLYKSDPNLIASHLNCPWVVTWDDHEVVNNYANLAVTGRSEEEVLELRRAAYQAYYEHQPLRIPIPDDFGHMQIYRSLDLGDLATLWVLDTRQYRDDQACMDRPGPICSESQLPGRPLLGAEQKAWLKDALQVSDKIWNVIAQQIVFLPVRFQNTLLNPDMWDGYPVERQELLDLFAQLDRNVIVLSGDIHAAGFGRLPANAADLNSETVAYEVVCTSISSGGDLPLESLTDLLLPSNPHIQHLNAADRGYAICDFRRDAIEVTYRIVDTVAVPESELSTDAAFRIDRATFDFERTV